MRAQFRELCKRISPCRRIGAASNVLQASTNDSRAVWVSLERAPSSHPGLWLRVDIFGRMGYRQTFYPFWRDPEVFNDFLVMCEQMAESEVVEEEADERFEPGRDLPRLPLVVLENERSDTENRTTRQREGPGKILSFIDLEGLFDHILMSGNRVAIRVQGDGPELWVLVWRRPDGGLFLRWGGPEVPAGPVYRESPAGLYQKLSAYSLDLDRVWTMVPPSKN